MCFAIIANFLTCLQNSIFQRQIIDGHLAKQKQFNYVNNKHSFEPGKK